MPTTTVSSQNTSSLWDEVFNSPDVEPVQAVPPLTPEPVQTPTIEPAIELPSRFMSAQERADMAFLEVPEKVTEIPEAKPVEAQPVVKVEPVPVTKIEPEGVVTSEEADEDYTKTVFKDSAKKLIKQGIWKDVEGFDEMEIDEDTFADLSKMQVESAMGEAWQSIKESNAVVNGILSVIEAGGNPDSIIDLFKAHQAVQQIDTTTQEGKLEIISKFQSEIIQLTATQLKSKMKRLEASTDEEINEEFSIAEEKYNAHFQAEQTRIKEAETNRIQQETDRKNGQIRQTAEQMKAQNFHQKTAQKLLADMYDVRWRMPDGSEVSELDYQLLKLRNDPVKSIELARFALDYDNYIKSKTQVAENNKVDETYGKLQFKPKKSGTAGAASQTKESVQSLKDLYKTI